MQWNAGLGSTLLQQCLEQGMAYVPITGEPGLNGPATISAANGSGICGWVGATSSQSWTSCEEDMTDGSNPKWAKHMKW